jgi:cephalosporin-C deacetylase-like acetyl esterase
VGDRVNLGGAADGLGGSEAALAVDKVRGEDGVDERRLSEAGLSCRGAIALVHVS